MPVKYCLFTVLYNIGQNYGGILVKIYIYELKKSECFLEKILKRFTFERGGWGVLKSEPAVHFFFILFLFI